jgi:TolB-like protein
MMKSMINHLVLVVFSIYILFGNSVNLYAQENIKKTIAVLTFDVRKGISNTDAGTLSDRLRTELVNLDVFTVLERGQMYAILQEQGFNQTGCTTSECAVEAGRLLGVETMVAGVVGKVGDILTIDVRVFDVETGKILQAHQYDYEEEISGLLTLMKVIAQKISDTEEDKGFPWIWVSIGVAVGVGVAVLVSGSESNPEGNIDTLPGAEAIWPPR